MEQSDKLRNIISQIKEILKENDIAGLVVIQEPGYVESLLRIETGYSCVKMDGERIKIRAKLEDFQGDTEARMRKIKDTSDMFRLLTETTVEILYPIHDISEKMENVIKAEHVNNT